METETTPKATAVNADYGCNIINSLNTHFPRFVERCKAASSRDALFKDIFDGQSSDPLWKHLAGKFGGKSERNDFGHFYLNLDNNCQTRLLNHLFSYSIDLVMPEIPDWEELRDKYFSKNPDYKENFDQEDVRNFCVTFGDKTKWDIHPHSMVWISKFLLMTNNQSIDGQPPLFHKKNEWIPYSTDALECFNNYRGDKYGIAANWNLFWNQAPVAIRKEIVERLITYNY